MENIETKAKVKKDRAKAKRLADNYNLTLELWQTIFVHQGKVCAICKRPMNRPNVDHRHADGRVNGILCSLCNRALGKFRDRLDLLINAVDYLQNPPAVAAIGYPIYGYPGRVGTKKHKKWLKEQKLLDNNGLL